MLPRVLQVVELGQVGKAGRALGQNYSFYAHSQREAPFGDATGIRKALQHAAKHAGNLNVSGGLQGCTAHTLQGDFKVHMKVPHGYQMVPRRVTRSTFYYVCAAFILLLYQQH